MIFAFYREIRIPRLFPVRRYGGAWVGAIGTFFGGDFAAITEFYDRFWYYHDAFLAKDEFVGAEQELYTTYVVYADETWIQPNWQARTDPWFATWSFWTDPQLAFLNRPRLISSHEMIFVPL
jgi:hypothetical protein